MTHPLIRAEALEIGYGNQSLLPPLSLRIDPHTFWAVVGRNGSGKTTLFRTLLGLQPPVNGRVHRDAALLPAYVPQRAALDPLVPLRVWDVVSMGGDVGWNFLPGRGGRRREAVGEALARYGMADWENRQFHELSEGQKQKVLMARVLARKANIVFLDEPTAAMDTPAEHETLALIRRMHAEDGISVVIISHFLGVARTADRVLFLDRDCAETLAGTPDEVFGSDLFQHLYGSHGDNL